MLLLAASRRFRSKLGLPTRDVSELEYRINRLPESTAPNQRYSFPWGEVEYRSASDLRGQYSEIFVRRHYAVKMATPEPVIVDAGGNIGMSAIWFKQNYPGAKLTVYEADPELAAILARNLAAANISEVDVRNSAVWIHDGFVNFECSGRDSGAINPQGGTRIAAVDLASNIPERVDLLKLDVEGAEYAIIERLCQTGAVSRIQNLVAEVHVKRGEMDRLITTLRLLRDAGFEVTVTSALGLWLGPADSVSPFETVGRGQSLMELYAWR